MGTVIDLNHLSGASDSTVIPERWTVWVDDLCESDVISITFENDSADCNPFFSVFVRTSKVKHLERLIAQAQEELRKTRILHQLRAERGGAYRGKEKKDNAEQG